MALHPKHSLYNTEALSQAHVETWVAHGPTNDLIKQVDSFGEYIASKLQRTPNKQKTNDKNIDVPKEQHVTTSQIRQVFGKLKSIEAKGYNSEAMKTEFLMLKPLLAYAAGRHDKTGMDRLKERVTWGIDAVVNGPEKEEPVRFKNFCKLFEAILAYHKAHGGK